MLTELINRYPALAACKTDIEAARELMIACFEGGGKLLVCGNGGSAADAAHISGELLKGFLLKRPLSEEKKKGMKALSPGMTDGMMAKLQGGLPALPLPSLTALNTAFANDVDPSLLYAQGVMALGRRGDLLLAISTSGSSVNTVNAALTARALGLSVLSLTGEGGGKLLSVSDVCVRVPEKETFKVQEYHLPVYHYLCAAVEAHFFG